MTWAGKRIFITGASGFIGSHLVKRLSAEGAQLHVLLRKQSDPWRISEHLGSLSAWEGDLTELSGLRRIMAEAKPQFVFHLGARVDVRRSWDLVLPMIQSNVTGTANLLSALQEYIPETFLNVSSSEEYGSLPPPLSEDMRESPISPYSFSKLSGALLCQLAARTFDVPAVNVRLFPTYGPLQESSMFIPSAIKQLLSEKQFSMSPGEQLREFNYVDDVVEALLRLAACRGARGEIVNVGSAVTHKIRDVVEMIRKHVGNDAVVRVGAIPYRKAEGMACYCDNRKLVRLTGWSPSVPLEEGLRRTVRWYRSRLES